jgi:hypothetical protein
MASITNVIRGTILVQDSVPRSPDFGAVALFTYTTLFAGWRTYTVDSEGLSAMIEDGFGLTDPGYQLVEQMAQVQGGIQQIKLYARTQAPTQTYELTPTSLKVGFVYRLTVKGTPVEYEVQEDDTFADIVTGLFTELNPIDGVTAVDDATHVTLSAAEGTLLQLEDVSRNLSVEDVSAGAGIAADLAEAVIENPDFMGFLIDTTSSADLIAAANWAASNNRIFLGESPDTENLNAASTTDVAAVLQSSGNNRAGILTTHQIASHPAARLMARQFARTPGTSTGALKAVGGKADSWTQTQISAGKAKSTILYVDLAGVNSTLRANLAGGWPLDRARGVIYLETTLALAVLTGLMQREITYYTEVGVGLVVGDIETQLKRLEGTVLVEGSTNVTAPIFDDIPLADRANRILRGIKFIARLAGAIEEVEYQGTLTL